MSGFYTIGKQDLLARSIPADAGIFMIGVNDTYIFDASQTDFNVFVPYVLLPEAQLTGVVIANGILHADNHKWIAAAAGVSDRSLTLAALVLYFKKDDVGTLLACINSAQAGLPQLLTGVNVTAKWDARGILKL